MRENTDQENSSHGHFSCSKYCLHSLGPVVLFIILAQGIAFLPAIYSRRAATLSLMKWVLPFNVSVSIVILLFCGTLKFVTANEVVLILVQLIKQSFNSMHVSKELTGKNFIIKIVGLRHYSYLEYFTSLVFSNYFSKLLKNMEYRKQLVAIIELLASLSFDFTRFHLFRIMNSISTLITENLLWRSCINSLMTEFSIM